MLVSVVICTAGGQASAKTSRLPTAEVAALKRDFERPADRPAPKDNASSAMRISLGRTLFFDTSLSGSGRMSCATCHDPAKAWGDGRPLGIGDKGDILPRRSPTIVDSAWSGPYFWDGRASSLEEQAKLAIGSPTVMNIGHANAVSAVAAAATYRAAFAKAYPGEPVNIDTIAKAIAVFERSVVSPEAPFDRWISGDRKAISAEAKRGFVLFNGKANCAACHSGWRFTDDGFHDIGLRGDDVGRAKVTPKNPLMQFAMKTPTLRNVALRAPYMHDGSVANLAAVIDQYDSGGVDRPSRAAEVKPLQLTPEERGALIAFLNTLTTKTPTPEQVAQRR